MKKPGSTSAPTASEPPNKFVDSTSLDLQRDENLICQHFSMRGYVADMRNTNPKACIPFDGISQNTWEQVRGSLDVPRFRYWRCNSCVDEVVPSSFSSDGRLNAEQTSLQSSISEREKDFRIELRASNGSELGDSCRFSEAINMVGNDGEREYPYTSPLELLASVAETVFDHPNLQETCHGSNAENDSSFEQITAGEGDRSPSEVNDLVDDKSPSEVNDLVDRDDERKVKKVRSLKELTRVNETASSGISVTAHFLPHINQKLSLSKQKKIRSEVEVQELIRPQGSRKAKRSFPPPSASRDLVSKKHAKATGSFPQPNCPGT